MGRASGRGVFSAGGDVASGMRVQLKSMAAGLVREQPAVQCCGLTVAQRYREVWWVLADSTVRGKCSLFFLGTLYSSVASPLVMLPRLCYIMDQSWPGTRTLSRVHALRTMLGHLSSCVYGFRLLVSGESGIRETHRRGCP